MKSEFLALSCLMSNMIPVSNEQLLYGSLEEKSPSSSSDNLPHASLSLTSPSHPPDNPSSSSFVSSHDQLADIFTKALPKENFHRLRHQLGMCSVEH
jgi:hypothetical protein